jgi:hypothetical protein
MDNQPATLAEVARRVNRGEQPYDLALPEFLDMFYMNVDRRTAMIEEEPEPLADPIRHAFFGAIGEHLARRWGLPIPAWTSDPSRFLKRPYFATPFEALKAMYIAESPIAFRRRLIFTEAEPLRRARMPREKQPAKAL